MEERLWSLAELLENLKAELQNVRVNQTATNKWSIEMPGINIVVECSEDRACRRVRQLVALLSLFVA